MLPIVALDVNEYCLFAAFSDQLINMQAVNLGAGYLLFIRQTKIKVKQVRKTFKRRESSKLFSEKTKISLIKKLRLIGFFQSPGNYRR